jgi:hypothetical protein
MFLSKGGRRWEFMGVIHQISGIRDPLRLDRVIKADAPRLVPLERGSTTGPCRLQMLIVGYGGCQPLLPSVV